VRTAHGYRRKFLKSARRTCCAAGKPNARDAFPLKRSTPRLRHVALNGQKGYHGGRHRLKTPFGDRLSVPSRQDRFGTISVSFGDRRSCKAASVHISTFRRRRHPRSRAQPKFGTAQISRQMKACEPRTRVRRPPYSWSAISVAAHENDVCHTSAVEGRSRIPDRDRRLWVGRPQAHGEWFDVARDAFRCRKSLYVVELPCRRRGPPPAAAAPHLGPRRVKDGSAISGSPAMPAAGAAVRLVPVTVAWSVSISRHSGMRRSAAGIHNP